MHDPKRPIVILGPTAGGKSALAVGLAERLDGEVVGADAFQVYRHLDAGTAKPDPALRERAAHHLVDIVEPTQAFTVHNWLKRAHEVITDTQGRGKTPIVVGGTNLYLKALLDGMFDGPGRDAEFRAALEGVDTPALHDRLKAVDPDSADRIKPRDRQRLVRALEVYEQTGQPISAMQTQWESQGSEGIDATLIGLRWNPESINPRINLRVKAMFYPDKVEPALAQAVCINGESLIDEVKRLNKEGRFEPIATHSTDADAEPELPPGDASGKAPNQARAALGYKQVLAAVEGTDPQIKTLDDAFEKTKVLTRRFAKQQRTWLKRFTQTRWIECDQASETDVLEQACQAVSLSA